MDPTSRSPIPTPSSQRSLNGHTSRTSSTHRTHGLPEPNVASSGETLRRGHSDGDVLGNMASSRSRNTTDRAAAATDRDAWMQYIMNSSSRRQDPLSRSQVAASRMAMMAADRRRRLAEQSDEPSRRRTSSFPFVQSLGRPRQNSSMDVRDRPFTGAPPPPSASNSSTQTITDRPLPPRPSIDLSSGRRSREITLPPWQADSEVSKCPICRTAFTFWSRKHHCRKCGRVVCANCSPHRITIPRQFIVHPPEEAPRSPVTTIGIGAEVVDLTGDSDADDSVTTSDRRPQSSDYRIDPALGGGQEVRLCNRRCPSACSYILRSTLAIY